MSGVTDMPFRRLVTRCGVGLVVSEMIASKAMIHAASKTLKMATHCAEEHPMAVQLAGCEPEVVAEAARIVLLAYLLLTLGYPGVKFVTDVILA